MLLLGLWHREARGIEDFLWIDGDMGYHRGVFARYILVLFHLQYHPYTHKGIICLL